MAAPVPAPGEVYLHSKVDLLVGGDYALVMTVTSHTQPQLANATMPFTVGGERYALAPGDFQLISPAAGTAAAQDLHLPFAVFYRRTLPWEQAVDSKNPGAWIALLLLRGDNELVDTPAAVTQQTACLVTGKTIDDLLTPSDNVMLPQLSPAPGDRSLPCKWLEIGSVLFQDIAPSLAEIDLLAHVRQVSTDDKELLGQDEDGWFSVVCGSRFPQAPAGGAPSIPHTACLVSLQGHAQAFADPTTVAQTVRVLVLASWEFRCEADASPPFRTLAGALSVGALGGPAAAAPPLLPAHASANGDGRVPVSRTDASGTVRRAWYRGPCSPIPVARTASAPLHAAAQGLASYRPDVETTEADITYATAFEVGRLLALADQTFALDLINWRKAGGGELSSTVGTDAFARVIGNAFGDRRLPLDTGSEEFTQRATPTWFPAPPAETVDAKALAHPNARFRRVHPALTRAYHTRKTEERR